MLDKESLLKPRLAEAEVDLPGVGSVRVRALSRQEVIGIRKDTEDLQEVEIRILVLGLVEPKLTETEVRELYGASPAGELEPVTEKIAELSGMAGDADKAAAHQFRN